MNTMTHAIKQAGIALPPANKRIWLWLKDNPNKTTSAIASSIGIQQNNVATVCSDMAQRNMLQTTLVMMRVRVGKGHVEKTVLHYSVHPKMRGEYELLPKAKKEKGVKESPPVVKEKAPAPAPYTFREPSTGFPLGSNVVLDAGAENALHTCAEKLRDKLGFAVTPSQCVLWLVNAAKL